jgi:uncharacterized protein
VGPTALTLSLQPGRYAVAQLAPAAPVPAWAASGRVTCVVRTPVELSIVCDEAVVPQDVRAERGFCALVIDGALDFALTGILASVTGPLAAAGISLFAFSTYDTDYVMVKADRLDAAIAALSAAGHEVH